MIKKKDKKKEKRLKIESEIKFKNEKIDAKRSKGRENVVKLNIFFFND